MRAVVRRLPARLGRRGAILTLKGVIASLYGYGLLIEPLPSRSVVRPIDWLPLSGWAVAWMCAGATALVCAWLGQDHDWPGFLAVWLVTVPWALSFLLSWWPFGDNPRGWITAAIFGAFGLVCLVAVGWPEPGRGRTERARERRDADRG